MEKHNYWEDIDSRLKHLVKNGYVKLPSLEGFEINNSDAIDLLNKKKSNDIVAINSNPAPSIKPLTTKIYNLQSDFKDIQKSMEVSDAVLNSNILNIRRRI